MASTPPRVTDTDLINDTVASTIEELDLSRKLDADQIRVVRTIGAFIMQGMALDECCILAHMDPRRFAGIMTDVPEVQTFVVFKQIAYKASLMRVLTNQAINGLNEKVAGWILEKKYREEFGVKSKDDPNEYRRGNALEEGIKYVQENGDSTPIVRVQSRDVTPTASDSAAPRPVATTLA